MVVSPGLAEEHRAAASTHGRFMDRWGLASYARSLVVANRLAVEAKNQTSRLLGVWHNPFHLTPGHASAGVCYRAFSSAAVSHNSLRSLGSWLNTWRASPSRPVGLPSAA